MFGFARNEPGDRKAFGNFSFTNAAILHATVIARIEAGAASDAIGCVRNFSLTDGANIREQLLSLSDLDHSFSYSILEADIPLQDYIAHFSLLPVTDGNTTFATWSARFTCPTGMEDELKQTVSQGVFQAGFDALKARFT